MSQPDARREGIPSLAEIFFGRLANLWRVRRARRGRTASRPRFESLENRLLLSADLIGDVHWDPAQSRAEESSELFVVDGALKDSLSIGLAGSNPLILDRGRDGIEQITQALAGRSGVTAVHILSHGASGSVALGSATLDASNLDSYASQLEAWAGALTADADILFYGCDVASGESGSTFVEELGRLTSADVAASTDLTGSGDLGGDWDLEYATGSIDAAAFASDASLLLSAVAFAEFFDPNPASGNQFGATVVELSSGNVVVTSPGDDAGGADAGAVYLFNGQTGALISALTGSTANDGVGASGIILLNDGNFLVHSVNWDNGAASNAGAVTFVSGLTGVAGAVSAANSLVGTTASDQIGSGGITLLGNGNYLVRSLLWDNGAAADAGAVTFGSGTTGVSGTVSEANSLVGSTMNDQVGSSGITLLSTGNYLVRSTNWDNGAATDAGAATFGSGTTGVSGTVSAANSLVGSTTNDRVGSGGSAITLLSTGNYVVTSTSWNNAGATAAGAVTFGSGTTGVSGVVSAANSLVGTTANDQVGSGGITSLTTGNYVVRTLLWNNAGATAAGAVTFGSGTTGVSGVVSAANSLVGSTSGNQIGIGGITLLSTGNYLVSSFNWDNGAAADAGAVTFGSGTTGVSGAVSAANSLVGATAGDRVGVDGFVLLSNGNYLVRSLLWDNGTAAVDAGAVTFGSGTTGVSGVVSAANSLVGSSIGDSVGSGGITLLGTGNYVVRSTGWDNGLATNAGAVTFGSATTGVSGAVSAANSLIGTTASDQVGNVAITLLSTGNYVVRSPVWDNGAVVDAGAVTFGSGTTGVSGVVSAANSLIGSTTNDLGSGGITLLSNGNYVVRSPFWDNGAASNAGAATFGSGTAGVSGVVDAANSVVGSTANDRVGDGIFLLSNGNYLVHSLLWDNGAAADAGAVTFGSGTTGVSGVVGAVNSLVGSTAGDQLGLGGDGILLLSTGNYLVRSLFWNNGAAADAGAMTFGSGATGVSGVVSAANSLVGSTAADQVGSGLTRLSNGNYVVSSPLWNNGALADAGAVTFASGTAGVSGVVSAANSLVGGRANDRVGSGGITVLSNGNYVVISSNWGNVGAPSAGAVTFGSGTAGVSGLVSAANSLVGSSFGDQVGGGFGGGFPGGITLLSTGNYLVRSLSWHNPANGGVGAGAVTFGNGTTGVSGVVSAANSLVGSVLNDGVGSVITLLSNGNFVVGSPVWNNGTRADAGAVTFGSGTTGVSGEVSAANSLVGTTANDQVGSGGITLLDTGNYVVRSVNWDNGAATDAGALTFGSSTTGVSGAINAGNSAIGLTSATSLQPVGVGNVNGIFFGRFLTEGGGRIRVGSQGDGFPNTVNLSVSAAAGTEAGTTAITVTASAEKTVFGNQTIGLGVSGATITAGDYSLSSSTITILDGQTTGSVTFTVADDTLLESTETATLSISNLSAGLILGATTTHDVVIADNESATLAIAPTSLVTEAGGAQTVGVVTLTITGTGSGTFALGSGISVTADVTDAGGGTAVSGTDYTAFGTQTVTFDQGALSGATRGTMLTAIDDGIAEEAETVHLSLGNLGGSAVAKSLGNTGNITTIVSGGVFVDDGHLFVIDVTAAGRNDTLVITSDTANSRYVIAETNAANVLFAGAGATQIDATTVYVPFSAVTGDIHVNTLGGDDSLTVDFSLGNFSRTIAYDGGAQTSTPGDSLVLSGGAFATGTFAFTSNSDGTIGLAGNSLISYVGLEPIIATATIGDLILTFDGGAETITLTDAPGANLQIDSTLGESVTFANPTSSLIINAGSGDDTLTVNAIPDFTGSLTINGQAGSDNVVFAGLVNVNALSVAVGGSITDAADADIDVTGNASFSAALVTLGDQAGNVINFGSLTLNTTGAVSISEDSDTVLSGSNTAGTLSITSASSITDAPATSIAVSGNASFTAGNTITLGDVPGDTTNFGSLTFNTAGAVNITEDSAMVLEGSNVGGSVALTSNGTMMVNGTLRASGSGDAIDLSASAVTLNGNIVTRGGAVTILSSVVLGSPATVTIDTTDASSPVPVPTGRSIVITGTVNDDLAPTSLVLLAGTVGAVNLQGAVGGTTPIQGLTVGSANIVRLPSVNTREGGVSVTTLGAGDGPFMVLGGSINTAAPGTANAGNVSLTGPVRLGTNVQITTDLSSGADGSVSFAGTASTINNDPANPGPHSLTIVAGGGSVSFGGAVGNIQPLQSLTINAGNVAVHALVTTGSQSITATGNVTVAASGNAASLDASGAQTIDADGGLIVRGGAGSGLSARVVSSAGQTISASSISVIGGSVGNSSFAEIRNDGTGEQKIDVTGLLSLTGGTGGAPDQGNFAQIRAAGLQTITAGDTTLVGGASGSSNGAIITSPNQDITILGNLTLRGGGATSGVVSPAGARIGGINATLTGGMVSAPPGPTDLELKVSGDVTLTGGSASMASIGSTTLGGTAPATITMTIGRGLTLDSLGAEARIGSASANLVAGNITINAGTSGAPGVGNITINGRTGIHTLGEIEISTPGNLTLTGGTGTNNRTAQILSAGNQTIDASSITLTGGSASNSSFAQIYQTGALGIQSIKASSITIKGGVSGADNFARIRTDATDDPDTTVVEVVQRITGLPLTGSPLITITGGTGGGANLGNIAQIRASGAQVITAGPTTITAGASGANNFAAILSPNQNITIDGNLTLKGGGSSTGVADSVDARIGGLGGATPTATNLMLTVHGSLVMEGGTATNAGSTIGSSFAGGLDTAITLNVDDDITLGAGTATLSSARIGAPNVGPLTGGDISITAGVTPGGNIFLDSNAAAATRSVIRTSLGNLTINANNITVGGSVISATQSITATGDFTVGVPGAANALVSATGPQTATGLPTQTISAGGTLTVQGGAGTGLTAEITSSGGQSIRASGITVLGGGSGTNSFAEIRQTGLGANQTIVVTGGGTLSLQGGLGGVDNFASIRSDGVSQTITVNGGAIALTGGNGPDVAVPPDTSNNFARIQSSASQTINAGTIALNGALSGTNNFTSIQGLNQIITTTGDVTLSGGPAAASNSGSRIGGVSNTSPTNLDLDVGGDLVLTAGAVTGATLGSPSAGGGNTNIVITVDGDFIADGTGGGSVRIGSPEGAVAGGDIEIDASNILFSGRAQLRTLGKVTLTTPGTLSLTGGSTGSGNAAALIESGGDQTIEASTISLIGGSVGNSNFAQIYQTGALGIQSIKASSITIKGGVSGADNFARIRNDATDDPATTTVVEGVQRITGLPLTGSPLITITGGTGGVPGLDLGNFAQIRASGAQNIIAGNTTITAGGGGVANFAGIHSPDQDVTIHGDLTLTGGNSAFGLNSGGAARIGGIGGAMPGPTKLLLTVDHDVTMTGGDQAFAGAVIGSAGSDIQGDETTDIEINVGGDLTMNPGTVANAGSRIGSPSGDPEGGIISVIAGGDIEMNTSAGLQGSVIRTTDKLTLEGHTITVRGLITSGTQSITADGGLIVQGVSGTLAQVNASGGQTINAQFVEITAPGGSALIQNFNSGDQRITAGSISIQGPATDNQSAGIITLGGITGVQTQTITTSGAITINGGTALTGGVNFNSGIFHSRPGLQSVTAANIVLQGGTAGTNNSAFISATNGGDQEVNVSGSITLAGGSGSGSSRNRAGISILPGIAPDGSPIIGTQTITGNPNISLTGGVSGGVSGAGNSAFIEAGPGTQTINAGTLSLTGGAGGIDNGATITAATQIINVAGNALLTGSTGSGNPANARIGAAAGVATDLTLDVGGDLVLKAGSVSGANLGATSQGGVATKMLITVDGDFIADGTAGGGVRIGSPVSPASAVGGGDIEIHAGLGAAGGDILFSGRAQLRTLGEVMLTTTGLLSLTGGSTGSGNAAFVRSGGDQTIEASTIALVGGGGGTLNSAGIFVTNGSQEITVGAGGITITGGANGTDNIAQIMQGLTNVPGGSQTITVNGGNIELQSGAGGTNNGTFILGANQRITATGSVTLGTGSVTLTGGGGIGNSSIIGGRNGVATDLALIADGHVTLTGGSVASTGAAIGTTGPAPLQPTSIEIHAGGNVILDAGDGTGARIGSSVNADAAGGDIFIDADGNIVLEGTSPVAQETAIIRTLGNVRLEAGGSISENSNGLIQANSLTTTSDDGTTLTGPNQVAVFNATNTISGNVSLVDDGELTVTGISNPVGDISVSTAGQMTVTGSLDSGTHDMLLTAPGGVVFTPTAVVNVDLAGITANQFTNITISHAVSLAGRLDADLVNPFTPMAGNRFQFMTFALQSGSFGFTDLPPGFTLESNPTFLELVFAAPSISINDVTLLEGNSGTATALFDVSLSSPSTQTVMVNYSTADGTAQSGNQDYQPGSGILTFAPGETSKQIAVAVNGDLTVELDETFFVNLSAPTNAVIGDGQGVGTIDNDDTAVVSISNAIALEGDALTFAVTISNAVDVAVTANRATADGTATVADADYTALPTSNVTLFAAGSTTPFLVTVNTTEDATVELDEQLQLILSSLAAGGRDVQFSGGGVTLAGTGTILNDDAATGGIDLVGAVEWDPDDLLIPGDRERVTVVVTNEGDTAVHDQVTVKLYASADEMFDASDVFLDESHTGSNIQPGDSKAAQFNVKFPGTLRPGEYFLLAVVDPANEIAESNEFNNTAIGDADDDVPGDQPFDFRWMFGQVPGHGRETLTVRDDDGGGHGTWVNFSLIGPGTGEITIDNNGDWDLVVTGTTGSSILSILTLGGGDHRVALDDIHVTGALRGILAPKMDLTGTLAIDGALGAGMMIGSATDAVIAVETILGTRLLGLSVQGIAILGDLKNSEILIGADLGADGQLGGSDDTYSGGDLGDLLIIGSMISSCVRVGQDPGVDGIFDNGDDVLLDGSIDSITILGQMTADSCFVADDLLRYARIDGKKINTATDPRFVDADCGIDWNGHAGSGWGAGYSPFGSRTGSGHLNFSDFLMKLIG